MKKNRVIFSKIRAVLRFILLHRVHRAGFEPFSVCFISVFDIKQVFG